MRYTVDDWETKLLAAESGSDLVPTRDEHQWVSTNLGSDAVFIAEHETNACASCAYRALVYAYSATTFTVTMALHAPRAPPTMLQAGVPFTTHVAQGGNGGAGRLSQDELCTRLSLSAESVRSNLST